MSVLFVIDLETTGFNAIKNDAITLGLLVLNDELKEIDSIYLKFKPTFYKWMDNTNIASDVHGFTLSDLVLFPERRDSLVTLLNFLAKYKTPDNKQLKLFYHAKNSFDYLFLEWLFRKEELHFSLWKVFNHQNSHSTIDICEKLKYEENSLKKWGKRLKIVFDHHNALADARVCAEIIRHIVFKDLNGSLEELIRIAENKEDKGGRKEVQVVPEKEEHRTIFDLLEQ